MQNCTRTIQSSSFLTPSEMIVAGLRLLMSGLSLWLVATSDRLLDRLDRHRQIRQLHSWDDRMLRDIGISRCDLDRLSVIPTSPSQENRHEPRS